MSGADVFAPGGIWWTLTTFGGELNEEAKKYFVILSRPTADGDGYVAKCTSKGWRYLSQTQSPCGIAWNPPSPCYRIDVPVESCFDRTTYVQYDKIATVTLAQLVDGMKEGKAGFITPMDSGRFLSLLACVKKTKSPTTERSPYVSGRILRAIEETHKVLADARKAATNVVTPPKTVVPMMAVTNDVAVNAWWRSFCVVCHAEIFTLTGWTEGEVKSITSGSRSPTDAFLADADAVFRLIRETPPTGCTCTKAAR